MTTYTIDGSNMTDRAAAHAELARALRFPDWYGGNLDALWDMASTLEVRAVLVHPAPMLNALGAYGCKLLQTLFEVAQENPTFKFEIRA